MSFEQAQPVKFYDLILVLVTTYPSCQGLRSWDAIGDNSLHYLIFKDSVCIYDLGYPLGIVLM